jgi:hypothetical protein
MNSLDNNENESQQDIKCNLSIRHKLEQKLLSEMKHVFWSYQVDKIENLPDELIIEKILESGNNEDWRQLKMAFGEEQIEQVWENQMLLYGRNPRRQKLIVSYFFNVDNPSEYIASKKQKKLS